MVAKQVPQPQAQQVMAYGDVRLNIKGEEVEKRIDVYITRPWYRFFSQLFERTGGGVDIIDRSAPTGEIKLFGMAVPEGYLLCDGTAVSRTTFVDLFNTIGTAYGVGDGSLTFNLPDGRGRMFIGAGTGAGLSARALGDTGGTETHQLTTAELAAHTHGVTDGGHTHGVSDPGHVHAESAGNFVNDAAGTEYVNTGGDKGTTSANTASATTGLTVDSAITGLTVDSAGSDTAHENMSPFLVGNWGIKT